jgi:bleomycin hydrolase
MVSLVNDPRHEYYREMTVQHLGNVFGGQAVRYLNVPIEDMKDVAARLLIANRPVWFGCDVGQFFDSGKGINDLDAFDYQSAFKTDVVRNMSKADRLTYGESLMTHAMVWILAGPNWLGVDWS